MTLTLAVRVDMQRGKTKTLRRGTIYSNRINQRRTNHAHPPYVKTRRYGEFSVTKRLEDKADSNIFNFHI